MSVDALIPGTTLQRGTPWLAATRILPEPRLPQEGNQPRPRTAGSIALALSALVGRR